MISIFKISTSTGLSWERRNLFFFKKKKKNLYQITLAPIFDPFFFHLQIWWSEIDQPYFDIPLLHSLSFFFPFSPPPSFRTSSLFPLGSTLLRVFFSFLSSTMYYIETA